MYYAEYTDTLAQSPLQNEIWYNTTLAKNILTIEHKKLYP